MPSQENIRSTFRRNARALAIVPESAHRTAVTEVSLHDGLRCEIQEGPWRLVADMSEKWGGASGGPNPGVLGRGAIGSCLAVTIATWAAVEQIPLDSIHVRVEADYDARAIFEPLQYASGYEQVRLAVTLESPAPEPELRRLMEFAEAATGYVDTFRRPVDVTVAAEIVSTRKEAVA
ncbi:MAG: hypothetical protein GC160_21400 [Acidobacteria bacterium]|nr:hypothetical protein [Acidobacteriota bacterium]